MSWLRIWDKSEAIISEWTRKLDPFPLLELHFDWKGERARGLQPRPNTLIFMEPVRGEDIQCIYNDRVLSDYGVGTPISEEKLIKLEKSINFMPVLFQLYSASCQCSAICKSFYWGMGRGWTLEDRFGQADQKASHCPECGSLLPSEIMHDQEVQDRFGRLGI